MGRFLESEKIRQAEFKASSPYFSSAARYDGVYRNKMRPFCLPAEDADKIFFQKFENPLLIILPRTKSNGMMVKMANQVIIFVIHRFVV